MPRKTTRTSKSTRSGFEKQTLANLTARKVPFEYEPSGGRVPYDVTHQYLPDVVLPNGIVVEVKGWFKPADRTKHLLLKRQHPDLDVRFLFQRASNKLSKTSKTTYAQWCARHGFQWAEGVVPQDWIDER